MGSHRLCSHSGRRISEFNYSAPSDWCHVRWACICQIMPFSREDKSGFFDTHLLFFNFLTLKSLALLSPSFFWNVIQAHAFKHHPSGQFICCQRYFSEFWLGCLPFPLLYTLKWPTSISNLSETEHNSWPLLPSLFYHSSPFLIHGE